MVRIRDRMRMTIRSPCPVLAHIGIVVKGSIMNRRKVSLPFIPVLVLALIIPLFPTIGVAADDDPVLVVSRFYEGYLNLYRMTDAKEKEKKLSALHKEAPLFSKGLEELWAMNGKLCELSRGDDMCGFSADEDIYLKTQESGPDLNFKTSKFTAALASPGLVVASFTVYPGWKEEKAKADYWRNLRFVMVREDGGWRVDDFGRESGVGSWLSARKEMERENAHLLAMAKNLQEAWDWVSRYITSDVKDAHSRALRYFSFPVEIVDETGARGSFQRDDKQVAEVLRKLRDQPFMKADDKEFGKKESVNPMDGDEVRKGALVFRYMRSLWWIVKVDFSAQK